MMDDKQLVGLVKQMTEEAVSYRDELSEDRGRATNYYNGDVEDLPTKEGRSAMVSKDVRSAIKKVMPSLMRTLLGNEKIFEYQPVSQEDIPGAKQASDYVNYIIFAESGADEAIHDAFHDALLLRSGIVKAYQETKRSVKISTHSGLDEIALGALVASRDVDVLEQSETTREIQTGQGVTGEVNYTVKIRRTTEESNTIVCAVPPEEFLIHPDARTLEDSPFVGQIKSLRRGDLVAMGYDKDKVYALPAADQVDDDLTNERDDRVKLDDVDRKNYGDKSLEEIDFYELYVLADRDEDGIGELLKCTFGGHVAINNLLEIEDWDEQPFVDFCCERQPHQWQGAAIADDVMDVQKVKTSLMRATLDNIYWQNRAQPIIQDGALDDEKAVFNPEFGLPIRVAAGRSVRDVLDYNRVPFVADSSFSMLEYFDKVVEDRTGITDASAGLDPDALQNVTATATTLINQAGIGQTEMLVKALAKGMRRLGKLLLHLVIQHQDKPRTVRLRNEWVQYDMQTWNAAMDVTVNTGLGAGTRERDMQMMQVVLSILERLIAGFGPDNPFVKPDNLYNTVAQLFEAAGLTGVDKFLTKPDPQEIQRKLSQSQNNPEQQKTQQQAQIEQAKMQAQAQMDQQKIQMQAQMEQQKIQAQAQMDQAKLQIQIQLEQAKMQANRDKEQAQLQADLQVKAAEQENDLVARQTQLEADATRAELDAEIQREKLHQEYDLKIIELEQQRELAFAALQSQELSEYDVPLDENEFTNEY